MSREARGTRRADSRLDFVYDLEMIEAVLFSEAVREETEEDEETRMGGEHPRSEEAAKADDWKTHGQR